MEEWRNISIEGIASIEKVCAVFEVWCKEKVPYGGKFKIKILENILGDYTGIPNVAFKDKEDGSVDWICGYGNDVSEALEDTIKCFLETIQGKENLSEDEFEWNLEDF